MCSCSLCRYINFILQHIQEVELGNMNRLINHLVAKVSITFGPEHGSRPNSFLFSKHFSKKMNCRCGS